jgi:CRISPR-associated protein Cas5d
MEKGIKLHVWGDYACFTRPEFKAERVSYDVITPSAARGVLESIYWKPAIRWVVDKIHVLRPIRFTNLRRNEIKSKIPAGNVRKAMASGDLRGLWLVSDSASERTQRSAMVLRDVAYVIEAHFDLIDREDGNAVKHFEMFRRRASKGQCFHRPCLGTREFDADFALVEEDDMPASDLRPEHRDQDLGWMLHDMQYGKTIEPRFFRAKLDNSVIHVPPMHSIEVRS